MIIICSHNSDVRRRWRDALGTGAVIHELVDFDALKSKLLTAENSLVLLHLSLPELQGRTGVATLRQDYPRARLLIFADKPMDDEGLLLLQQGIYGYCNTYMSPSLISSAVAAARAGEVWLGWNLMQRLIEGIRKENEVEVERGSALEQLTEREWEIALHVAQGANNKRIASDLGITERTVKAHLSTVFRKAGVQDRLQLALLVKGRGA
jgi:DNA-binding NarL/FixJ family response regulator